MRIVHLAKYHSPFHGGMESHVESLARKQAQLGADVCIICINSFDDRGRLSQHTKTEIVYRDNVQVIKVGRIVSALKLDVCPSLFFYIRHFAKFADTVFHVHTPNPTMLLALMAIGKIHHNVVITHHSDAIRQKVLKYLFRPIEYWIYRQAKVILTTSKAYQSGSKFLRLYEPKLDVLPLGLDLSTYKHPQQSTLDRAQQLKAEHGDVIWLAVGRMVYYKSFHIALAALQQVPGKLLIVGTGKLMADLQKTAYELNVADRVVWLGKTSDEELQAAYHAATALWFPSSVRSEAFGMVQVEAMASGCPTINCDIAGSGVPWVCRDEREGLTVPINDARAFAGAARRLLEEEGLRERLAKGARIRADKFSDTLMAQRSLAVYHRAAKDLRSPTIELEISGDFTP
jgi:glycosyltransferase involved in cell wall biosynthesis